MNPDIPSGGPPAGAAAGSGTGGRPPFAILAFDRAAASGDKAESDVLVQLDATEASLRDLGWSTFRMPVDLDFQAFHQRLLGLQPDLVFNLVESVDLADRLQTAFPLLLEEWGVRFTGSGSLAMLLSNHKIASKRALAQNGLSAPPCAWLDRRGVLQFLPAAAKNSAAKGKWILKALESHASVGLGDDSVRAFPSESSLATAIADASARNNQPFFAEWYIDGREFNISIIERRPGVPSALPPAEILFLDFPDGKAKIVGFDAKWEEDSGDYVSTPRRFLDMEKEAELGSRLKDMALAAWYAIGLSGYGRVDFRVDADGAPHILEVNSNPCLSPDAGLAAAANQAGMSFFELVERIVEAGQAN